MFNGRVNDAYRNSLDLYLLRILLILVVYERKHCFMQNILKTTFKSQYFKTREPTTIHMGGKKDSRKTFQASWKKAINEREKLSVVIWDFHSLTDNEDILSNASLIDLLKEAFKTNIVEDVRLCTLKFTYTFI